jgi:glycosyltransferase involved in cell wall biosynthesis
MLSGLVLNDRTRPLVSMCIFNYNYGRYLRECLESVFAQTYDNIEICFSDNASTDDSWDIALEYARKYPGRMSLTRNRINFGSDANLANCMHQVRGKYFVELCSDDALEPDFTRQCVHVMNRHPEAGYVMVHREIIDENGNRTKEPPFYNQSCIIPGPEQAAVYMMAAVNPSISQIMYDNDMAKNKSAAGGIAARWYGTRLQDFNMCCAYSMAYIKEPLLLHRVHSQNDSSRAAQNLLEVIGPFVLFHQYAEIAALHKMTKAELRLQPALDKLSSLCLRYCVQFLCAGNETTATRYFHLAVAIVPGISEDPTFKKLDKYWSSGDTEKMRLIESLQSTNNLASRSVSYDPPPGSVPIELCQ